MQCAKKLKLFLSLAAGSVLSLPAPAAEGVLSDCRVDGLDQPARCGVFEVPENPDRPDGRRLNIHVVVIPAAGGNAPRDPVVPLMGGPGENLIGVAAAFAERLASLHQDRDFLFVDQRGTGRSAPLQCELYAPDEAATNLRDFFPLAAVRRCEQQLRARADLTQYTYQHFAADLEHVRRALGYGPLNLYAGSYGTRAAQVYMRAYPQSVRTVYLGSVVPIDVAVPLPLAGAAQSALENTFSACEADRACQAAFPHVREEFHEIMARLDAGSVRVAIPGRTDPVPLYRGRFAEWIRSKLYRPTSAVNLPWLIHQAYVGDWNPVVEGILSDARARDAAASFGLFFSITCNDDIAFLREQDIAQQTQGTFLGDYRVRQQQAACRDWPKVAVAANYREPVRSSVPTLLVSGDSDPATPVWFTTRVAPSFSNRAEIVVAGHGHTEWNNCISKAYEQLVQSGSVEELKGSTCAAVPRPPFKIKP